MDNPEPTPEQADPSVSSLNEKRWLARGVYLLPNSITTGALFAGFYAIIAAMSGSLGSAAIALVIAGFLDALDGRVARLTNTQSEFGVQYDSLSDMVAFGVAPAALMFSWILSDLGKVGWMIAFLYMACAALRLARFNTAPDNSVFYGLASPAAAGIIATVVWTWLDNFNPEVSLQVSVLLAAIVSVLALLMVSNVRYYSPKQINVKGRVPFVYMLVVVFTLLFVTIYPPGVLLAMGSVYVLSGPVKAVFWRKKSPPSDA